MRGILEGFSGIADFFASWWGLIVGVCLIVLFVLVGYVVYLLFKSYFGVDIPVVSAGG